MPLLLSSHVCSRLLAYPQAGLVTDHGSSAFSQSSLIFIYFGLVTDYSSNAFSQSNLIYIYIFCLKLNKIREPGLI